ncbi:MAG TPA: glycosyltransferase family A protein [Candidatus Binatia bacterium]|nr:glycosyltransferase family A protein [Candidatus Binatia bacterium]
MTEPRISVVIPNFNHARFLPRCLDAQLNQPVLPYEIIVVDDGSTDNSLEVLREYEKRRPVIRVCPNERNLGTNQTINRGLELARGDYVGFHAADDEVRPGIYEHFTRLLRAHPEAGAASGMCEWRCTSTGQNWYIGGRMPNQPSYLSPDQMVALGQSGRLAICSQNAVFKKSALLEADGYIPELRWFADWYCAYVVGFRYGMCHVPEVLSNFYLYPQSYFNADASARGQRRAVMRRLLEVLESEKFADVARPIGRSGLLGEFGWSMARVAASDSRHRRFLTPAFIRYVGRRSAQVFGRRFFPDWLARWCLKVFYGRRSLTEI